MRKLLVLVLLASSVVSGQQRAIDSLEKLLSQSQPDTALALNTMWLAKKYEGVDPAKAHSLYEKGIAFCAGKNLNYEAARMYIAYAGLLVTTADYDSAALALTRASARLLQSGHSDTLVRRAEICNEMANVLRMKNDFKGSFESRLRSVTIYEQLGMMPQLARGLLALSGFFKEQGDYEKQEYYALKALNLVRQHRLGDTYFIAYAYAAFAKIAKGGFRDAEGYIDSARLHYDTNYSYPLLVSFHLIAGLCYMNLAKLDKAKTEFENSYSVAARHQASFSMIQSRLQLARVLSLQKKFSASEKILQECYEQAKKTKEAYQLETAVDYLSRLYRESGQYRKALEYYTRYRDIADSISNEKTKNYASELEVKYETEKKKSALLQLESENHQQKFSLLRQRAINLALGAGLLVLIVTTVLGFRNYRNRQLRQQQRIAELETEKKLAATEAVLKGEEQERTRLAKDLHDGLGGMLSGIKFSLSNMKGNLILTQDTAQAFSRSIDMLDSSIREMRRVAHNLMPEALLKFGLDTAVQDFCHEINQSGALKVSYQSIGLQSLRLEPPVAISIYRVIQELVNNILKHAGASNAIVQLVRNDRLFSVTVEDDGKGFDRTLLERPAGIGWSNIRNRIDILKGKLDLQSEPGKGTSVHIELGLP